MMMKKSLVDFAFYNSVWEKNESRRILLATNDETMDFIL